MFSFLLSANSKMRRDAANWLEVADRVYHYRRDLLSGVQLADLQAATGTVRDLVKAKAPAGELKAAIDKLEPVLARLGGRVYPLKSVVENVEFFLGAAIIILGLRAYFFQPFKIPTNSMWPTYNGMTHEVFAEGREPGLLGQAGRFLAYGATRYTVAAPADGEILVPVLQFGRGRNLFVTETTGRNFGIFPALKQQYVISVGGEMVKIDVPVDFDFDRVLEDRFAELAHGSFSDFLKRKAAQEGERLKSSVMTMTYGGRRHDVRVFWVPLGVSVRKGENFLTFDILTGDLLFVDRISYNFIRPKVGDGFVFKTANIASDEMKDISGRQIQQYYIKRLVGTPGDRLEIRSPQLLRNGEPIDGAQAFADNAQRNGRYPGYENYGLLANGRTLDVPEHFYFALGDNSPRSKDSRYWGYIPEKDVVGRPLVIYYPFGPRWGPAR